MLRLMVEHRLRLAWLAIALCAVGLFFYQNSKIELLPRTHQRRFAVVFAHSQAPDGLELLRADEIVRLEASRMAPLREVHSEITHNQFFSSIAFDSGAENLESRLAGSLSKAFRDHGLPSQVQVSALGPESFSVIDLVVESGNSTSNEVLTTGFMKQLDRELSRLPEVAYVSMSGSPRKEYQLASRSGFGNLPFHFPQSLAAELSPRQISENRSFGTLLLGKIVHPETLADVPLRGRLVAGADTLGDAFDVTPQNDPNRTLVLSDGKPAMLAKVFKTRDASEVEVSRAVRRVTKALEAEHPKMRVRVLSDAAEYIEAAQRNVMDNLQWAIILTCLCILVIARNVRYTLIVSLSIPLSLFLSFPLIHLLGVSRNIMSLAGITLSVGVVVDATISVIDGMEEWMARGFSPSEAAIRSARENLTPVMLTSLTTLAVFVPILFLPGTVGDLFRDLSITVIVSQTVSFVVAIFVVPGLTSIIYDKLRGWEMLHIASEKKSESAWPRFFIRAMRLATLNRLTTWTTSAVLLLAALWSITLLPPSEFLPKRVTKELRVSLALEAFDLPEMRTKMVRTFDEALASLGATRRLLEARAEVLTANAVLTNEKIELRDVEAAITKRLPGRKVVAAFQNPIDPQSSDGKDIDFLVPVSKTHFDAFKRDLPLVDGIRRVRWSDENLVHRGVVASGGSSLVALPSSPADSFSMLRFLYGDVPVGKLISQSEQGAGEPTLVALRMEPAHPKTRAILPGAIDTLTTRLESTRSTRILVDGIEMRRAEIQIGRRTSSEISGDVEALAKTHGLKLFWGASHVENFRSLRNLAFVLAIAGFIISLLLYAQNRSVGMTIIILFTFVWGLIGSIPALAIHGETMNASALVGFILLVGTIVNNGILLVQIIEKSRRAQASPLDSCLAAVRQRTVPVLVTALTTAIGMIPMAFDVGEGSQMYRALSIVVVYGTIVSTPLSLVGIPCLVLIVCDARELMAKLWLRTSLSLRTHGMALRRITREF